MAWYEDDVLDGRHVPQPDEELMEREEGRLRESEIMAIRRETYRKVLEFVFSRGRNTSPHVVLSNLIGLVKSHAPDLIDGASLAQFAAVMGRTKAALSHQILKHQGEVIALAEARQGRSKGHHAERWQQGEGAVEKYREAQKGNRNRRRKE
jgi:hypothetical protein